MTQYKAQPNESKNTFLSSGIPDRQPDSSGDHTKQTVKPEQGSSALPGENNYNSDEMKYGLTQRPAPAADDSRRGGSGDLRNGTIENREASDGRNTTGNRNSNHGDSAEHTESIVARPAEFTGRIRSDGVRNHTDSDIQPMKPVYESRGNLAIVPQWQSEPDPLKVEAKPVKIEARSKPDPKASTGKRSEKKISTKAEADWLKRDFPSVLPGEAGRWDIRLDCAGFNVYFRVDKRQNNGEPINLKFPRISREMFLTLKGMNDNERKTRIENYVAAYLITAIEQGNDRARAVAARLVTSS